MEVKFYKNSAFWSAIVLVALGWTVTTFLLADKDDKSERGDRPFQLTKQELSSLSSESAKGNCMAAYRIAQYHLYSSLDLQQAEKYYRLAARCPNANALAGLIVVLRKPEHDTEIDQILVSLKKLDPKMGESAAEEVTNRRAERTSK